jgi:indole-3-glycerol phosphate synthase
MTPGPDSIHQPAEFGRLDAAAETAGPQDLLTRILASVRRELETAKTNLPREHLARMAHERAPRGDAFASAIAMRDRVNVIAECKRRSPSKGVLSHDYQPARIARGYEAAGAAAVSVLTEPQFFGGSIDHLREVRAEVSLPLLRKDFIVDEYQLLEARAAGADAVLLITAALDDHALKDLIWRAGALGLAALVEVHNAWDLERAIDAGAAIIGINNRDLRTQGVDLETTTRLIRLIPEGIVAVAESGIESPDTLARMRRCGCAAVLIGGYLMSNPDPGRALGDLLRAVGGVRDLERSET